MAYYYDFSRKDGWPIMVGSNYLNSLAEWTQVLADTLTATVGNGVLPVGEEMDTGWITPNLKNGFVAPDMNRPVQVRKKDGITYWRGFVTTPSSYTANSWAKMLEYDQRWWSPIQQPYQLTDNSDAVFQVDFRSDGLYFWSTTNGAHTYVAFGFCYPAD